ncbi:hypothetical protein EC968_000636 [Mortierella alpina]|nr:hypothetical protein EC968_000636 [Mortierella alpina]
MDNSSNSAPEATPAWIEGRKSVDPPAESSETWLHRAFRGSREGDLGDGWNKICAKVNEDHVPKYDVNVASLLLSLSSASYLKGDLAKNYQEWFSRGLDTLDIHPSDTMYAGPYADFYLARNTIVLVFKGTNNRQEIIDDLKVFHRKDIDRCQDGKCKQTCYRHTESAFGCGDHCVKGCDGLDHGKYLRGDVHQGFYNLLFGATRYRHADITNSRQDCKNRARFTEGPACAFETIMTVILAMAEFYCHSLRWTKTMNLWITGHSLGGALASLCMARLQTIVQEDDPLVRGLSDKEKELFVGHTVLDVMSTQFLKSVNKGNHRLSIRHCRQCRLCACAEGENQTDCQFSCRRCDILRMREEAGYDYCCLENWQQVQTDKAKKIIQVLSHCNECSKQENEDGSSSDSLCENCHTSCRQCGQCEPCKKEKCQRYLDREVGIKRPLVLRDCYTFGSPKVGDSTFAKQFEQNRKDWAKPTSARPVKSTESQHWRVAVQGDQVTKQPLGLLGYEHIGEHCPIPTPTPTTKVQKHDKWYQKFIAKLKSQVEWIVAPHYAESYYDSLSMKSA